MIVRTAKNYKKMMRSLYLFDAMISSISLEGCKIHDEQSDYDFISNLIEMELSDVVVVTNDVDEYLKKEWDLFLQQKKKITLNLSTMNVFDGDNKYNEFNYLYKLIMYDVVEYEWNESAIGKNNVLKPEWLSIFP